MSNENKVPRRAHLELNLPAELAIRNARAEVEVLGAHPGLTNIVIKLGEALDEMGDWFDNGAPGAYQNVSLTDKVCADPNVSDAIEQRVLLAAAAKTAQEFGEESECRGKLLRRLVELIDSDEDGGEGVFEEAVERLAEEARAELNLS